MRTSIPINPGSFSNKVHNALHDDNNTYQLGTKTLT